MISSLIAGIAGWEWIIVLIVVIAVIFWGPQKIPELARALGKARGEFTRASKEFEEAAKLESKPKKTEETVKPTSEDVLLDTAEKLGISTEGKTREEIQQEIINKVKESS